MPNPNDPNAQMMTPQNLANQLFDKIAMQNPGKPQEVAGHVIGFLAASLMYAISSAKADPVAYLTETLLGVVMATTSGDEAARKEQLKTISSIFASVADPSPQPGAPASAPASAPAK